MSDFPTELSPELLKAAQGFLRMVVDPSQSGAAFDMAEGLLTTDLYEQFVKHAYSQPEVAAMLQSRYLPPAIDLDVLLTYPPDSLGYLYASTLKAMNLDPNFYRQIAVQDDYSYIALRMRQTHDIWHVITGFGSDLAGELGLQAFTLAQTRSPLAIMILAATLLHILKTEGAFNSTIEALQIGWQMGLQAKPFLAQAWEEQWDKSIAVWRTELNVTPV